MNYWRHHESRVLLCASPFLLLLTLMMASVNCCDWSRIHEQYFNITTGLVRCVFTLHSKSWIDTPDLQWSEFCPAVGNKLTDTTCINSTYPDRLLGPPSLLYNGYRVFPGGKGGRGVMLTTHPLLVPRLRKSWAIPPLTLWVLLDLLRGSLYLYLYVYK